MSNPFSPQQQQQALMAQQMRAQVYTPTKRVYISTPLSEKKFDLAAIQRELLASSRIFAFIPTTSSTTPEAAAALNKMMIENSDEVWVFGPIGRDCSWEIGYAQGRGIKVIFFKTPLNADRIESDWMLFCAGTEIKEPVK